MTEHTTQKTEGSTSRLEERVVFFFVTMGVIAVTYGVFVLVDFLPEKPETEITNTETEIVSENEEVTPVPTAEETPVSTLPTKIIFDTLGREVLVLNPMTDSVAELDAELLKGVVRHPDSADFEKTGTIFLLGHSSYLPVVNNKNFQAFNGIQKLLWGDTIRLQSADTEYVYSVDRVYEAKASDAEVPIEWGKAKLVLATCNSFGSKDDRFIVEASFVSSHPLGK